MEIDEQKCIANCLLVNKLFSKVSPRGSDGAELEKMM
jgi:hypothetical protein